MHIPYSAGYIKKALGFYETFSSTIARNAAVFLLVVMFLLMYAASKQESAVMDELAHIPAGYSYLTHQDMRINPEHPPLLKDIAAFPLLFLGLNFPDTSKAWVNELNSQWDLGTLFLYGSGNDPDRIVFWARMGPMLLTALFGFFLFKFGAEFFGKRAALLALLLFAFSPAVLAHGKYVTTDIAAAFGFFIGIAYFLRYLNKPSGKNLVAAGIAFGVAQALKFSLILLIPFLFGIAALWAFAHYFHSWRTFGAALARLLFKTALVFAIGYIAVIWPLYQFHIWNYPAAPEISEQRQEIIAQKEKYCPYLDMDRITPSQFRDTVCNLKTFRPHALADVVAWASDKPALRPFAEYALGTMMVGQRTVGGNTTYFLGKVSRVAWWYYFPIIYLIKEPLALHLLTFMALLICIAALRKKRDQAPVQKPFLIRAASFAREHFIHIAMLLFVLFYWTASIAANLNIGIRHIIPALPFTFLLVSYALMSYLRALPEFAFAFSFANIKKLASFYKRKTARWTALAIVLAWYIGSVAAQYPYLTAYFNELAGGPTQGYTYVADSNLDWGQDMKRLAEFVRGNNIDTIRVAYFGGGSPEYYLKDRYVPWWSSRGPESGWFAISATFLDGAFGTPIGDLTRSDADSFLWLRAKTPVTTIGHSIFVYKLE
ncbi:glycosyltransferase family 39 protein [Candidatus Azambacteria bacterium]|nr:glycosyltransferase family 39 protein [Candidatus Azambacteria bacterium]